MAVALLDDVHTQAEQRKQEILSCDTEIVKSDTFIKGETYTGTPTIFPTAAAMKTTVSPRKLPLQPLLR